MKKNNLVFVIAVLLLVLISACNNDTGVSIDDVPSNDFEPILVEDRELIQELWDNILFDSIASIGNSESFYHPSEIEDEYLAIFAYMKIARSQGFDAFEQGGYPGEQIISIDQIKEVVEEYWQVQIDKSELDKGYSYNESKNGYTYGFDVTTIGPYDEQNPWGIKIERVFDLGDGQYEVNLVSFVDYESSIVQTRWVYNIEKIDNKNIIKSLKKEYPENNLTVITGDIETFQRIENYLGDVSEDGWRVLYNIDSEKSIIGGVALLDEYTNILGIFDAKDRSMPLYFNLGDQVLDIYVRDEKVVVKEKDRILIYDLELELIETILVPDYIIELMNRDIEYDDNFYPMTWFGGYDINNSLNKIAYSDEEGLKEYDLVSNSYELLTPTLIYDDEMTPMGYASDPRYLDNDLKVFYGIAGYEGMVDYSVFNFETGMKRLNIGHFTQLHINIDQGIMLCLDVNSAQKFDFNDLQAESIKLTQPLEGYTEWAIMAHQSNDRLMTFALSDFKRETMTNIYYADMEGKEIIGPIASVTRADVRIRGVLGNDKVLCSYGLFPNEYGYFVITP
jgi:predicted  nucleic acid-binding Zn-ribbon protein